ncbi:MAG: ATP-binding protein [Candidatus Aminicenantes bacterium]|nr:MAG: ATP-binding protein [Candidatus Aminicenantes bacterium]
MERLKIFPFIFLIAITALVITLFTKGIFQTIILSIGIGIVMYLTKVIWLPEGYKRYTVRLVSLGIALSAAFSFGFWPGLFENIIKAAIETHFPGFAAKYPITEASPYLVFAFLSIVIWTVNYFNRDNTAMRIHPRPISKDIPDITFKERLKNVCISLSDDLRSIDIKTNWSAQYYTPLDAEVEVNTKNRKKKKIMDLLDAIKKSDDRLFLVLGDPGSGKSVALRKLAQDLSKEAVKTGKIPVYINLKEWWIENKWDENYPPTVQ